MKMGDAQIMKIATDVMDGRKMNIILLIIRSSLALMD